MVVWKDDNDGGGCRRCIAINAIALGERRREGGGDRSWIARNVIVSGEREHGGRGRGRSWIARNVIMFGQEDTRGADSIFRWGFQPLGVSKGPMFGYGILS